MKNRDHVNLHVHDEFSLLDGAVKTKDLITKAKEMDFRYMATTNHGSMDGIVKFGAECQKQDVKPIFGCELYMIEDWEGRHDLSKKHRNLHIIAHAKNPKGLRALLKGLGYANLQGWSKRGFAGRPFLPIRYPLEQKDWAGNVVIQTGCASSPFWNATDGMQLLQDYKDVFKDDLYGEIMPLHDLEHQLDINRMAIESSKVLGLKVVATNDIHFLCKEDHVVHDVILAIGQRGITWNNPRRWKFDTHLNFLRPANDIYHSLREMGVDKETARASILNTMEVAEKCAFKNDDPDAKNALPKTPVELPEVLAPGTDETDYMIRQCAKAMERRGVAGNKVYIERLDKEINAMMVGGIIRYMLMVHDLVKWSKKNGILVGPGRGSVGGSLVAYLLGITEVDPIRFGLLFERFLSEGRVDLPDIDLDFEDRKRYMVEQYLREKYGHYNVAHVSTYGMMKGKQAVQDVSRVFEVPKFEANQMSKCILVRPEQDSRASFSIMDTIEIFEEAKRFYKKYPKVIKFAAKIEGQIKTVGVHAAGLVVSKKDLRESGNCYLIQRKDKLTVNWDKEDLEQMGLMKLDILGLSNLSIMSEAARLIKERHNVELDYYSIPLDDKKVFRTIAKGNTVLGFQIGSKGLQKYCRELEIDSFEMLCDASALWRPGCLKAGITQKYLEVRHGRLKPKYFNSIHKDICKGTKGQIIYQEQIMFLLYNMAGIPWKTTDQVRKTISKQEGTEKWQGYKKMFAAGCKKKGTMGYDEAEALFDSLKFFGQYAFNLSHSVEYAILSYLTIWLKVYYPTEYICAFLNCGAIGGEDTTSGEDKIDIVLKEATRLGIKILPPHINKSEATWKIAGEKKLRSGLREVYKCGEAAQTSIMEGRIKAGGRFNSMTHLLESIDRRKANKGVIETLVKGGACDSLFDEAKKKLWKMHFEEIYPLLASEKKLQAFFDERMQTIEQDWEARQDDVIIAEGEATRFKTSSDVFGQYRKLVTLLKEHLKVVDLKNIDDRSTYDEPKIHIAQSTNVKFGYAERAKKLAAKKGGTADALGGIYGNIDDGTGYMMVIFKQDIYARKKKTIQKLKGEPAVWSCTKPMAGKSNVWVNDFTTLKKISSGDPGHLRLKLTGAREEFDTEDFRKNVTECQQCALRKTCTKPVPPSIGKMNIMVLGDPPREDEDREGKGFIGRAGRLLFSELEKVGIRKEDCQVANTVACRPPDNKLPNVTYITKCPWPTELIKLAKPKFILASGSNALYYFRRVNKGIQELNGLTEWSNRAEAFVTYSLNPFAALYDQSAVKPFREGIQKFAQTISNFI